MGAELTGGIVVDQECGRFVCDFVERLPTTDTGKPFELHPWQRDAIMEFYSTLEPFEEAGHDAEDLVRKYQYLYLEIPKKNGKSELAAALGLYHLFADGEMSAEVYVCAADKAAPIITELPRGIGVCPTGVTQGAWCEVTTGRLTGWVMGKFLEPLWND